MHHSWADREREIKSQLRGRAAASTARATKMMHTEGQARAAFAAEAAGARHFAATASARQVGETASAADSRTGRCYQLLARDEFNTWCLLDRHLRFEERQRQQQQQQQQQADGAPPLDVGVAWMREVLAWLEGMAQLPAAAAFGRCGWDKTCQGLAGRGATPAARIDALDPDACSRQQRGVHPDDRAAEDEFLRALWACVRAGDVQRAQEICRRSQQSWRAASLAPAGQSDRGATRRVWKTACRELAADPAAPSFERAVYAVLSADAGALQAFRSTGEDGIQGVLGSWYDKVWAWAKVWVDSHDDSAAQAGELPLHTSGEDMKQALDAFLHACSAATEEDCLAGTVAGTVESDGAGIAETWINDAVHFYRGVQELLIFTVPGLDQRAGQSLSLNRVWNSAPDGVFPTSLRWPLALNFSADRTSARLPTDIQQLGDDLSSQLTRTALHAGVLLAGSVGSQTDGSPGRVLASGELEPLGRDYIQLLAASIEDGASDDVSESLGLVAEYATWLPVLSQGDTLVDVLKDMPSSAWKVVLMNAALQPEVVAEVQYRVVQYIVGSSAVGDGDKLDALLWACSNAVDDGHDGLLMRMQGLRQVNGYLRKRTIEEGMDGLSGDPPYILLEVGKALCGAEMSDLFESMYETVSHLRFLAGTRNSMAPFCCRVAAWLADTYNAVCTRT